MIRRILCPYMFPFFPKRFSLLPFLIFKRKAHIHICSNISPHSSSLSSQQQTATALQCSCNAIRCSIFIGAQNLKDSEWDRLMSEFLRTIDSAWNRMHQGEEDRMSVGINIDITFTFLLSWIRGLLFPYLLQEGRSRLNPTTILYTEHTDNLESPIRRLENRRNHLMLTDT